jgi:hypothetical protein
VCGKYLYDTPVVLIACQLAEGLEYRVIGFLTSESLDTLSACDPGIRVARCTLLEHVH